MWQLLEMFQILTVNVKYMPEGVEPNTFTHVFHVFVKLRPTSSC